MAIQKIELSAALNSLATQSNIDKVTGMLGSSAANISKADLATVVAGVIKGKVAGGAGFEIEIPNTSGAIIGYFINNQHIVDYDQVFFNSGTGGDIIRKKSTVTNYLSVVDDKLCVYRKSEGGNLFVKNNTTITESIIYRLEII